MTLFSNTTGSLPVSLISAQKQLGLSDRQLVILLALSATTTYAEAAGILGYASAAALKAQVATIPHVTSTASGIDASALLAKANLLSNRSNGGGLFEELPPAKTKQETDEIEKLILNLKAYDPSAGSKVSRGILQTLLKQHSPDDILACAGFLHAEMVERHPNAISIPIYDLPSLRNIQQHIGRWISAGRPSFPDTVGGGDVYEALLL